MKKDFYMGSVFLIYVPSFIKIGSGIQKFIRGIRTSRIEIA
jgi:hypothetical protein